MVDFDGVVGNCVGRVFSSMASYVFKACVKG